MLHTLLNQANPAETFSRLNITSENVYEWVISNIQGNTQRKLALKVLRRLIGLFNRCPNVYIRQDTIAKKLQCRRETVNRIIRKFYDLGVIHKVYRHMTSCIYILNPVFNKMDIREELHRIITSFCFLPLAYLISQGVDISQVENNAYIFNKNSLHREMSHEEVLRSNINTTYLPTYLPKRRDFKGDTPPKDVSGRGRIDKETSLRREAVLEGMKSVKRLKLTRAGEIKLAVYPPEAIEYANKEYFSYKGTVGDHFKFYSTLCRKWCEENNKKPTSKQWFEMYSALRMEKLPKESPGINPKDPYKTEYIIPERLDPTIPRPSRTADSDNTPQHSIYHTAKPPVLRKKTPEGNEATDKVLREASKGASGGFTAQDFALWLLPE